MGQLSDNTSLIQPTQNSKRTRNIYEKCNECNKKRETYDESHQICHICYKIKTIIKPIQSGIKVIDDFIRYIQVNHDKPVEFAPYDQFKI
jgi:hypothetical protein